MAATDYHDLPLWFRQFLAASLQLVGVEQLPDRAAAWPDYFDNTEGIGDVRRPNFYKYSSAHMLPYKGRPQPVDVSKKIGIEAHITAVAFGTSRRRRKFWEGQIRRYDTRGERQEWLFAFGLSRSNHPWTDADIEAAATRMALHERFWRVPYHYVALLNGDVLYNNPITRYTYHGNGGNGPLVGVSLEGNFPGLEKNRKKKHNGYDEHTILTGRAALKLATEQSREEGAPIETLYAHRQYSASRLGDPGEGWWKEIGIPMSKELGLERRVAFKHGTGNPICQEWDPLGIVDYRGRPVEFEEAA